MNNNRVFNEKLHFSWGHIISSIALVAIAYCTFVGAVYLTGYFLLSGIITFVIVVLMGLLFFIPQQLKGTTHRFRKRIKWERAFIFSSPVLFLVMMVPFSHSWTVHHRQDDILKTFNAVIDSSSSMFNQYDQYAQKRISTYSAHLSDTGYTRENKEAMLKLLLLSSNYDMLKHASEKWMKMATNPKVSTWNIFLLGNIGEIKEAIHNWHECMQEFSKKSLSDEGNPPCFDQSGQYLQSIDQKITELTGFYGNATGFYWITVFWLLLGYAMLILPYLLQTRHSKTIGTQWVLFGSKNKKSPDLTGEEENSDDNDDETAPFSSHNNKDYSAVKI